MITQSDAILVLNAGSSSLKFSLYQASAGAISLVSKGQIGGLGISPRFEAHDALGMRIADETLGSGQPAFSHADALEYLSVWLRMKYAERMVLTAVGHRITHGGRDYVEPTLLTDDIVQQLEQLVDLAPLHQPHNLAAVKAVRRVRPDLPQIGCFDTAFHRGRSAVTERFGLPASLFNGGIKRWGFHGLSYESVVTSLGKIAPHLASGRVIVAHLGNGASLCALQGGRSVDSTMSFSTLDGLPMGTRCGSLDPGVILYLLRSMTPQEIETLLYTESGMLGISGISSDMRVLLSSQNPSAADAIDFFVYRVIREMGSLTAALGGLDALVFTAGIGVNSATIRARVCRGLSWLGISVDSGANERHAGCISLPGRSPSVWVIPTDEEDVIAGHTWKLASQLPSRVSRWHGGQNERALATN